MIELWDSFSRTEKGSHGHCLRTLKLLLSSHTVSLSQQEVAALADYFESVTAAGSFPPDSQASLYSGNIPDLIAVVSRLDKGFALVDPAASGLVLASPSGLSKFKSYTYNKK